MTQPTRTCLNHPDREATWFCTKQSTAYCHACGRCPHPEGYCKFRPQCLIWHAGAEETDPDTRQT